MQVGEEEEVVHEGHALEVDQTGDEVGEEEEVPALGVVLDELDQLPNKIHRKLFPLAYYATAVSGLDGYGRCVGCVRVGCVS